MSGMSLGLGMWLGNGGGASGPVSTLTSIEIMGATPLLDATNDYGDATARTGINGNGWIGKATFADDGASTFNPVKVTLLVSDPGFDETTTTTVLRTITGTVIPRRQYNAAASLQNAASAGTRICYLAFDDDIYQGSTILAAAAGASWYGAAASGSIATKTNSSTFAYEKAGFAWLNGQHDRATGDFAVECVAYHRRAQQGRQVARIEIIGADASGNSAATQTVSSTSPSSMQTKGQIVDAWKATVPVTALTQGDLGLINAKVYPWLGDSSAVLDLLVDGTSTSGNVGTAKPQTPLRFTIDKTGAYGGAHAAVQIGAGGGTVQATYALSLTTPYSTIALALAALKVYNNANKGHNDHSGGTIWLMETTPSGGATHTIGGTNVTAGKCLTDIKVDPAALGTVKAQLTALATGTSDMLRWYCDINQAATNGTFDGGNSTTGNKVQIFEGSTIDIGVNFPINYQIGHTAFRNVTFTGLGAGGDGGPFYGYSSGRTQCALALGCVCTSPGSDYRIATFALIGCDLKRGSLIDNTGASRETQDKSVIANNRLRDIRATYSNGMCQGTTAYTGLWIVQNVIERANGASEPGLYLGGDGSSGAMENVVFMGNTIPGTDSTSRFNVTYTDVVASAGVIRNAYLRFNLLYEYNCKSDTFTSVTTVRSRVGNHRRRYTVGDEGNVVVNGSPGSVSSPQIDGTSWLGERWPAVTYNVGSGNVTFTSNLAGAAAAGSGTYTLTGSSNSAYDRVPSGKAFLATDLAGIARKNDGTGAAGAYERTV